MVVFACITSIQKAERGGALSTGGQPGLTRTKRNLVSKQNTSKIINNSIFRIFQFTKFWPEGSAILRQKKKKNTIPNIRKKAEDIYYILTVWHSTGNKGEILALHPCLSSLDKQMWSSASTHVHQVDCIINTTVQLKVTNCSSELEEPHSNSEDHLSPCAILSINFLCPSVSSWACSCFFKAVTTCCVDSENLV